MKTRIALLLVTVIMSIRAIAADSAPEVAIISTTTPPFVM